MVALPVSFKFCFEQSQLIFSVNWFAYFGHIVFQSMYNLKKWL